jgi:hypothetical protein
MPKATKEDTSIQEQRIRFSDLETNGATRSLYKKLIAVRQAVWRKSEVSLYDFFEQSYLPALKERSELEYSKASREIHKKIYDAIKTALTGEVASLPERLTTIAEFCRRKSGPDSGERIEARQAFENIYSQLLGVLDLFQLI